jgi:hemoglobin-like flavoprotein
MSCCGRGNVHLDDETENDGFSDNGSDEEGFAFSSNAMGIRKVTVPLAEYSALITHFTPAQFPVPAHIDSLIISKCKKSWSKIFYGLNGERDAFCQVFYGKLLKKSPRFADVFPTGVGGDLFKHDLLGKALNMLTSLDLDTCKQRLTSLGKFHNKLKIRPWMYSDYFVTVVETLNTVLADKATYALMEQWYHALSFVSFFMLRGALSGNVIEGEVGVGSFTGMFEGDSRVALERVVKLHG